MNSTENVGDDNIPNIINEMETFICKETYTTETIEDMKENFPEEIEK